MANNSFQSVGKSPLGYAVRSPLGQALRKGGTIWLLGRTFTPNVQQIYEINSSGSIVSSGVGPVPPAVPAGSASFLMTAIGSDGSRLWYTDLAAGTIVELDPDTYAVIHTYAAPVTFTDSNSTVAISAQGNYVYWAYHTATHGSVLYKLNVADMSVVTSIDLTTLASGIRNPEGLAANADNLWLISTTGGIGKFDLNLNFISVTSISTITFPAGTVNTAGSFDGTNGVLRTITVSSGATQDFHVFEIDSATMTVTNTRTLDAAITEKHRSICGGK